MYIPRLTSEIVVESLRVNVPRIWMISSSCYRNSTSAFPTLTRTKKIAFSSSRVYNGFCKICMKITLTTVSLPSAIFATSHPVSYILQNPKFLSKLNPSNVNILKSFWASNPRQTLQATKISIEKHAQDFRQEIVTYVPPKSPTRYDLTKKSLQVVQSPKYPAHPPQGDDDEARAKNLPIHVGVLVPVPVSPLHTSSPLSLSSSPPPQSGTGTSYSALPMNLDSQSIQHWQCTNCMCRNDPIRNPDQCEACGNNNQGSSRFHRQQEGSSEK